MAVLCGLGLIYLGLSLLYSPFIKRYVSGYVIDTTGYNVPLGIFTAALGAALAFFSIKAKVTPPKYFICPMCEASFDEGVGAAHKCSKCNVSVVEMGKYFSDNREHT